MVESSSQKKARVFLVDDHALVRQHLTALLGREQDLEVCGEAEDVFTAFPLIRQKSPDLVILDISLKQSNGLHLLKNLKDLQPTPLVLILSMHDEITYAERALRAGARGYITKEEASIDVLPAIRTVLSGQIHLSQRMASRLGEKANLNNARNSGSSKSSLSDQSSVA